MTAEPIRIAVVGLGKIARDQHLPALAASPAFALAATVCPDGAVLEGVPGFATLEDLLEADDGDADRLGHSGQTETSSRAATTSGLRSGSANGVASISNTSPASVWTPSLNESVAVPKKCTWMSPGRRNSGYLK